MTAPETIIKIPSNFGFKDHNVYDFDKALSFFDWSFTHENICIDFTSSARANYQCLALLVSYIWKLRCQGCHIETMVSQNREDTSKMWRLMGAVGWSQVLGNKSQNFRGHAFKPLIAIRGQPDFSMAMSKAEQYTKGFNVEYEKTLRYVISELLYNTIEHGQSACRVKGMTTQVPSIIQFTWYKSRNEVQFIVADTGVGIKKHLEQAYPPFDDDESAIKEAIRPQVSGTFGKTSIYSSKNNAGVGLYISSNIVRRLNADMHILSGNGLVHISPRDITSKTLANHWPGTLVLVSVRLESDESVSLHQMMSEFREAAQIEINKRQSRESDDRFYLHVVNIFGPFAEDKQAAIKYRDKYLLAAIDNGKSLLIDFDGVTSAPHSFLSALFATPIGRMGMAAYKRLKVVNASPEIRETIDYILDENT